MSDKTRFTRDAFGFSLKGLRSTAAFAAVMAVADDGINAAWDEKIGCKPDEPPTEGPDSGSPSGRFWLSRHYGAT